MMTNENNMVGSDFYEKIKPSRLLFRLFIGKSKFSSRRNKCRLKAENICYFSN